MDFKGGLPIQSFSSTRLMVLLRNLNQQKGGCGMQYTNARLMVVVALGLLGFTFFACSSAEKAPPQATNELQQATDEAPQATNEASLKTPTKNILVTSGDFTKPYDILGEVECTLTGQDVTVAVAGGAPQVTKDVKDLLRKVAFTKYGEQVDAIINTKTAGGVQGGVWALMGAQFGAKTGTVTANGIAVHFK